MRHDVLVIGGGVAGLAAARELSGAGKRVAILEARPRLGGRILTRHLADVPVPIELGAEFIHGEAHATFSVVEAAALLACQLPDTHWLDRGGRWERIDFWDEIEKVRRSIARLPRDISFDEFLRRRPSIPPRRRQLARLFVEGYHASHADRISALALSSADEEQEQSAGNAQFRLLDGYDALVEWLRAGLDPERVEILLGTPALRLRWRKGEVEVDCRSQAGAQERTVRAAAALITLPIGVWKAAAGHQGAMAFDPPLAAKEKAIERLEVGHVVKIIYRFRERFWDDPHFLRKRGVAGEKGLPLNFVHSDDRYMPTWWTSAPLRAPLLTGWAGGHAAEVMLAQGEGMVERGLESLGAIFGMPRRTLGSMLEASYTHDWQSDPFSRGAYTYAGVGGRSAHAALARPVESTLYFAGEATSADQTGTVAGAVESGRKAAKAMLRR